jgi:hypothetical protein
VNNAHTDTPVHPEAGFREAGLDDLIKDVSRLGPAPNRSREAFVIVVTILLLGALIAITQPAAPVAGVMVGAVAVYLAVRWVLGTRSWSTR